MKTNKSFFYKIIFILLIISLSSCNTTSFLEIRTDIAETPQLNLEQFDKIMITNFLHKEARTDFDLNKEVKDYFFQELEVKTEKKASIENISPKNEKTFKEKEYWARFSKKDNQVVFITGSVEYKAEVRKALVREKRKFEDPFTYEDRFAERKLFSLMLDLYFIDSQTGEVLYNRKFNETRNYENPNQTPYFAFFDLIYNVKEKLFRDILDKKIPQKRYLILK